MYCVKQSVIEGLLKRYPNSLTKVAEHAYKRYKYFQTILRATQDESDRQSMYPSHRGEDPAIHEEILLMEENYLKVTEDEEEEMLSMMAHTFGCASCKEGEMLKAELEVRRHYLAAAKKVDDAAGVLTTTAESHARVVARLKALIAATPPGTPFAHIFGQLEAIQREEGGLKPN